jgi:hypothetical protein
MPRRLIVLLALVQICAACSGKSSPTAPSTPPDDAPPTTTPPPVVSNISVTACPTSVTVDNLAFYQQIGCNAFDGPMTSVRKWKVAPKLYIRTVDEAGAAIDAVTLDTVQNAMVSTAASLTGGKFGLASVERGTSTREGVERLRNREVGNGNRSVQAARTVAVDGGTIRVQLQRHVLCL